MIGSASARRATQADAATAISTRPAGASSTSAGAGAQRHGRVGRGQIRRPRPSTSRSTSTATGMASATTTAAAPKNTIPTCVRSAPQARSRPTAPRRSSAVSASIWASTYRQTRPSITAIVRSSVASTPRNSALRLVTPPTVAGRLPVRLRAAVTAPGRSVLQLDHRLATPEPTDLGAGLDVGDAPVVVERPHHARHRKRASSPSPNCTASVPPGATPSAVASPGRPRPRPGWWPAGRPTAADPRIAGGRRSRPPG